MNRRDLPANRSGTGRNRQLLSPLRGSSGRLHRPLFDWTELRDWGRFVWNSMKRHRALGMTVFVLTLVVSIMAAAFLPRRWSASTKLLARPTRYMASIANPNGAWWDEAPTRAARERVLARESLGKIAQQTDLVVQWQLRRSALLKMKDQLQQLIGGAWTADVWTEIVVGTLEQRLQVSSDEETVEISVEWSDPAMARRIVEAASQNFVETRHVTELAGISEAIGILELHASQTSELIDAALENLRRVVRERSQNDTRVLARAASNARARPRRATSQELAQLKFMLRSKQHAVAELEEQKARALTQARATLDQQLVLYNRMHPAVSELERRLDQLKRDSPQLLQLKRDVVDLLRDVEERGGKAEKSPGLTMAAAPQGSGLVTEASLANLPPDLERDPAISVAQEQVRVALGRHQELLMRVEAARLSLDTARAAFKYRFHAVRPPQTPKVPLAPNVPFILLAGLFLGVVLAYFATAGLDLFRRTVCEPWQIERQLKLPLLAQVREPGAKPR